MTKVIHLTSAHTRYDTRIFIKMCCSLSKKHDVSLIVADGLGNEVTNSVNIIDVGKRAGGRLSRMTRTVKKVFNKDLELDGQVYHLHDPELIPIGLKLKKLGKTVIFDSHEDVSKQMLSKPYLNMPLRRLIGWGFGVYEAYACKRFDAIVTATPFIRDKFTAINPNSVDINNFPLLDELANSSDWSQKKDEVVYVGGIAKIRGIVEIVEALNLTKGVKLNLAGKFSESSVEEKTKLLLGWAKVNELGFLNRQQINQVLSQSKVGLVTLHPIINYLDALPVKMFEYMASGLPVIASNFPLWKDIVEGNDCGLCVDPLNPKEIGQAIQKIIDNPDMAQRMGANGRKAVEKIYNWQIEEAKLFDLYKRIVK